MSFEIKIEFDTRKIETFLDRYNIKQVSKAVSRALDRTMVTVQKEAAQQIQKSIKLPIRDIKEALRVRKQYGPNQPISSQMATLLSSSASIYLSRFKPRQVSTGVKVNITGTPQVIPRAFLARMPNASSPSVFRRLRVEKPGTIISRVGQNRSELPIRKQATQGISRLMPEIAPSLAQKAVDVFYPRFNHELARRLKG